MELKSLTVHVDLQYMVKDARLTEARQIVRKLVTWGVIGEEDEIVLKALDIQKIDGGKRISWKTFTFTALEFAETRIKPGEKNEFL